MTNDLSLKKIQKLNEIMRRNRFEDLKESEQELIWEGRYELLSVSSPCHHAVPLLVSCVPQGMPHYLVELYDILDSWRMSEPLDALALLTPQ